MSKEPPDIESGAIDSLAGHREAAIALVMRAREEVRIFSNDLDPRVLGTPEFAEACRAFLLSGPRARLRALIRDGAAAVRYALPLVQLIRQMPSRAALRRLPENEPPSAASWLAADRGTLLYRDLGSRFDGVLYVDNPLYARRHISNFDALWEQSEADPEIRQMRL